MEVTDYTLFDVDKLSKIEQDILIALDDDINNRYRYYDYSTGKYKLLSETINLIKRNNDYNDDQIYEGLLMLCLKMLIGIKSEIIYGEGDYLAVSQRNTTIYTRDNYIQFIYLINTVLMHNREILRDDVLSREGEKVSDEEIDICLQVLKGLPLGKEKEIISSNIEKYRVQKNEDDSKKLIYYIRIIQLSSWINECIDNNPDDYIRHIALHYFDKRKMRTMLYIVLTEHINHGVNGRQMVEYIRQIQTDERYKKYKALEAKFDDIKEKVDSNLLRNIEIISIFVAAITIIIGNVSFIPQISAKTTLGVISLILIINGCLLAGTSTLVFITSKIISIKVKLLRHFWFPLILILLLVISGGVLSILDASLKAEIKIKQESTVPDIQNGLTIENNINSTNEETQPTVAISPEVSNMEIQATPTPDANPNETGQ